LITRELGDEMNQTSATLPPDEDEFPLAGLTAVPGRMVNVPRVGESRAARLASASSLSSHGKR